jgi:hypothetical protein
MGMNFRGKDDDSSYPSSVFLHSLLQYVVSLSQLCVRILLLLSDIFTYSSNYLFEKSLT